MERFYWDGLTGLDAEWQPKKHPKANMQTAACSWRFLDIKLMLKWIFRFCVIMHPFLYKACLWACGGCWHSQFQQIFQCNAGMQWYLGNLLQMVLGHVHSRISFGNWVFRAFLASCATPFDHAFAKFEFWFGFQDEGVNNDTRQDKCRGQGPPGD